jgi:hypothetical protein
MLGKHSLSTANAYDTEALEDALCLAPFFSATYFVVL